MLLSLCCQSFRTRIDLCSLSPGNPQNQDGAIQNGVEGNVRGWCENEKNAISLRQQWMLSGWCDNPHPHPTLKQTLFLVWGCLSQEFRWWYEWRGKYMRKKGLLHMIFKPTQQWTLQMCVFPQNVNTEMLFSTCVTLNIETCKQLYGMINHLAR